MKRRKVVDPIGLSALDLICGLFGLLVVLYAITDRVDGSPGVTSAKLNFVRAQVEHSESISVGLELKVGVQVFRSWPACEDLGVVRWARCLPGMTEGLVQSEQELLTIGILLLSRQGGRVIGSANKKVLLTTRSGVFECELSLSNGYRAKIDFSNPSGSAQCTEV